MKERTEKYEIRLKHGKVERLTSLDNRLPDSQKPSKIQGYQKKTKSEWIKIIDKLYAKTDLKHLNYIGYYDAVFIKSKDFDRYLVVDNKHTGDHFDYFL